VVKGASVGRALGVAWGAAALGACSLIIGTPEGRLSEPDATSVEASTSDGSTGGEAGIARDDAAAAPDATIQEGGGAPPDAETDAETESGIGALDAGRLAVGLVAFYRFDETNGTSAADSSGNGKTANMYGATFASGLQGNAATMNGNNEFVGLPSGIVSGLSSFSICAWVNLPAAPPTWARVFDFGGGMTDYMYLSVNGYPGMLSFDILSGDGGVDQQINAPELTTGAWQHVAVTLAAETGTPTGTLYVNGVAVTRSTTVTASPMSLGTTTQNWLGRSQFGHDPYLTGQIDNFRIYDRPLSAAEVQALFAGEL
jgi:hypothetical protein